MWNSIRSRGRYLLVLNKCRTSRRTFLSESYQCTEAWNQRLQSPLLSKINPSDMFLELDQRFNSKGKASAIDVDIFANTVKDPERVDELIDILLRLRKTGEATNILDSTHHAVIRYLFQIDEKDTLLEILNDRLNYGIFPDYLTYNILMDHFIKANDFVSALKIGSLLMLQEDAENKITNELAVYSCLKFLENPDQWVLPPPPPVDPKEEVVKVRVAYLRNPYFDDHFDIREPKHIAGKTLVFFGKKGDDSVARSCHLWGLVLWQKYAKATELVQGWIGASLNETVFGETLQMVQKELAGIADDKVTDEVRELKAVLEKLNAGSLKEGSLVEEQKKRVEKAVEENENTDIQQMCRFYEEWEKTRMDLLQKQLDELDRQARIEKVSQMKEDLAKRERLLTFFEKEEEIELSIERKLEWEDKTYGPIITVKEDLEENYVPPEIVKKSNKL